MGWSPSHESLWESIRIAGNFPVVVSSDVISAALEYLSGEDRALFFAVAYVGSAPGIGLILQRDASLKWQTWQPSQLPICALVATKETDLPPLVQGLFEELPVSVMRVDLLQLDPEHIPKQNEPEALAETNQYINTGFIAFPGSYSEYFSSLSKNVHSNIRKQRSKVQEIGGHFELIVSETKAQIGPMLEAYANLEARGWKQENGTAIEIGNTQFKFYKDVFERLAHRGHAQICQYWLILGAERTLVASDLCLKERHVIYMLKTAYHEQLREDPTLRSLSPAMLMHDELFARWISVEQIHRVEFYGRFLDWHSRWTSTTKALYHMSFYRNRASRMVEGALKSIFSKSSTSVQS